MAESQNHIDLVSIAFTHIKSMVPANEQCLIECDFPSTSRPTKVINGYIPDVYYWNNNRLIIGEAKTINDFDNKHSKNQIESYYRECTQFSGNSYLVICVPWQLVFSVKNYIRLLKRMIPGDVDVTVINELGWKEVL